MPPNRPRDLRNVANHHRHAEDQGEDFPPVEHRHQATDGRPFQHCLEGDFQEAQNGSGDDYHNYNFEPVFYVPDQLYPKVEESYNDVNSMFVKVMPTEEQSKAAAEADHDEE